MRNYNKVGKNILKLCNKLFPVNRSLTGNGVRHTLKELRKINPKLNIFEVKSGKKIFDWKIPYEWNVEDAWIKDPYGSKILDFKNNNLHLMGYSAPIKKKINLFELKKKIFTNKKKPEAIPYVTSYYNKDWGFCMSYKKFKKLKSGKYDVFIDSNFKKNGNLTYGEILIPGKSKKEILLSTYICHPSMANNELSGPCLLIYLSNWIKSFKTKYTYRIIFIPETIGSLIYLKKNFKYLKNKVIAGYVVTCVGDNRNYSYLETRNGNTISDKVAKRVLNSLKKKYSIYTWLSRGSDERNYCWPGFDLPIASIMRSKYGEYLEYHSSLDNMSIVSSKSFNDSFKLYQKVILTIENDVYPITTSIGEPNLGKRGLYHLINKPNLNYSKSSDILNILSYSDGKNSLFDIANKCKLSIYKLKKIIFILKKKKLIIISNEPRI
jgi:aminopeptidase-like protein